jgi:hypothetical protein
MTIAQRQCDQHIKAVIGGFSRLWNPTVRVAQAQSRRSGVSEENIDVINLIKQ